MYSFPIWNQSVVPCPVLTVASWPVYRFLRRQVRWSGMLISFRIFQFVVIHTVKGYGIVNKAEVDVFLERFCFFDDSTEVGILISVSSAFSKSSLNIWKFMVKAWLGEFWALLWHPVLLLLLLSRFSCVQLCATPWTPAYQAPLSTGFSRQEYWSGVPLPSPHASLWDECNCAVVWAFFGIAFLWDWNENWPFPVLWPLLSFPNLLTYWVQHFHSIIF